MPIEVYEVQTDMGATPPSVPAAEGADSGVPGAASETPATAPESAGAPPAPPSPSPGETVEGDASDEEESQAVTLADFNSHMARLRRRQRRAERALDAERQQNQLHQAQLQAQVEMLTRMLQGQAPTPPEMPQVPTGPPRAEDFGTQDEYTAAVARHSAQEALRERDQQTAQERQQSQAQQFQQQLMDREQAFKQAHPDFDQVVRAGLAGKVAPHVQQALMVLPDGPAVAYTLATQPELVQRLNTLHPALVFAELGRLSPPSTPVSNGPPPAAPTGSAPPLEAPLTPVTGQGSAPPGTWRPEMTQAEYKAWRKRTSSLETWKNR